MTQLLGTSRLMNSLVGHQDPTIDAKLQELLTLYKTPATIRDMKQTFFYLQLDSDISQVHPLRLYTPYYYDSISGNKVNWNWGNINLVQRTTTTTPPAVGDLTADINLPKYAGNPWYLPIGTTRTMDISAKINELLDIRVPKDKYVVELNLAECNIESDPSNFKTIPDYVFQYSEWSDPDLQKPTSVIAKPTYKRVVDYDPPEMPPVVDPQGDGSSKFYNADGSPNMTAINADPYWKTVIFDNLYKLKNSMYQATKQSEPETLFCRIRELSNGEPYNWSITNTSGVYSVDKNHQLLVLNRDIDVARLTLEFGHMVFVGRDKEAEEIRNGDYFDDPIKYSVPPFDKEPIEPTKFFPQPQFRCKKRDEISRFASVKYFDYNSEVFNVIGDSTVRGYTSSSPNPNLPPNTIYEHPAQVAYEMYPDFYRTGAVSAGVNSNDNGVSGNSFVTALQPVCRPPYYLGGWQRNGGPSASNIDVEWDLGHVTNAAAPYGIGTQDPEIIAPRVKDASSYREAKLVQGIPLKYNQQVRRLTFRFLVRCIHLF